MSCKLFLVFTIICTPTFARTTPTEEVPRLPSEFYTRFILANSLKLGQSCSWEDEQFRLTMLQKLGRFGITDKETAKIFDNVVANTIEKRRVYCKGSNLLVCDKATEKCVCGEPPVQAILGDRYKPSNYLTELDNATGAKVCRWGRGSPCDFSTCSIPGLFVSKCGQGLSCNSAQKGGLCTALSESDYLLYTIQNKMGPEEYKEGIVTGKVCLCGDEEKTNSTISVIDTGRIKRSIREGNGDVYEQAKAVMSFPGGRF